MLYYLVYPVLKIDSFLPWRLVYFRSSCFYYFIFYVIRYRRQVVADNLRKAFPEKTEEERHEIAKRFYRHFCDVIFEVVKLMSCSQKEVQERCTLDPAARELTRQLFSQNKNILWVMGHTGNWEMAGASFAGLEGYLLNVLYRPLSNRSFNKIMLGIRARFGAKPIAVNDTYRELIKGKDILSGTVFIGDQTPPPENAYWTTFLNQDTPVYKGTEVLARKLNYPVVYAYIRKVARGRYTMFMELLAEEPSRLKENELTEMHTRLLERDIRSQPFNWLWSHRRWKHKKPKN